MAKQRIFPAWLDRKAEPYTVPLGKRFKQHPLMSSVLCGGGFSAGPAYEHIVGIHRTYRKGVDDIEGWDSCDRFDRRTRMGFMRLLRKQEAA